MLLGILAAMFSFVVTYSKLQSVSAFTLKSSTVIRTFEDRALLIASRGKIVTVSFAGYLFFGSAVKVLEEIKGKLVYASNNGTSTGNQGSCYVSSNTSQIDLRERESERAGESVIVSEWTNWDTRGRDGLAQ